MYVGPSVDLRTDQRADPFSGIGRVIDEARDLDGTCSLADVVEQIAQRPRLWVEHVATERTTRSYVRIFSTDDVEIWILTWPVNTSTALHDHGPSRGAFRVIRGALVEQLPMDGFLRHSVVPTGDTRTFGPEHVHDVGNPFGSTAVSVHAYSPPLQTQRYYDYRSGDLIEIAEVPADDRLSTAGDPREQAA
jgi:cysteine dioxygenase type I